MSGIFISYRREETSAYAGRLYDSLAKQFGRDWVFRDLETLRPGVDFGTALEDAIRTSDVLVALIGPRWLTLTDSGGRRRLDNPDDWVRLEIATALARQDIRVVPVLVGGAVMPAAAELPEDLQALRRRNAFEIGDERWDYDVRLLIEGLEPLVKRRRPRRAWWAAVIVLVLLVVGLVSVVRFGQTGTGQTPTLSAATEEIAAGEQPTPTRPDSRNSYQSNNYSLAWDLPWARIEALPGFDFALSNQTSKVHFLEFVPPGAGVTCAGSITPPAGAVLQYSGPGLNGTAEENRYAYTGIDGVTYNFDVLCQALDPQRALVTAWDVPQSAYWDQLPIVNQLLSQVVSLGAP